MEKLQALKEKIAEHQEHLKELDKNVYVGFLSLSLGDYQADSGFLTQERADA